MAADMTITQVLADLEAAFRNTDPGPDNAFTIREMAQMSGMGAEKTRIAVRAGLQAGTWEHLRARRCSMDGTWRPVPVYRPKSGKGAKR